MNQLHPLGKLIQEAQDKYGWSTRDLERQADNHGYSMKHSNFSRLKLDPVVAIKATQIEVLSKVLRRTPRAVADAAIASMGVDPHDSAINLEDAVRSSNDLSMRDRRILLSVIDAMRDDESGTNDQQDSPADPDNNNPTLRAVASTSNPRTGQKNEVEEYGITEIHGDATKDYPVPPIESLAAHPKTKTTRELLDEETSERDVDNQEQS